MNNYINHSGGCEGADMEWDRIGREHGFNNHKHYRPSDLKRASAEVKQLIETDVFAAASALQRPTEEFPGKDLVRRNWFQANGADAIFAISRIVQPFDKDKGFSNLTGKQIVAGGTAWACEMAIQMGKPVHVFDIIKGFWFYWNGTEFKPELIPILTQNYAGIGSRNLTDSARQAIKLVYLKTLENEQRKIC
jgi:hypothetical protein